MIFNKFYKPPADLFGSAFPSSLQLCYNEGNLKDPLTGQGGKMTTNNQLLVDLASIEHNLSALKAKTHGQKIFAVVKADAYGLGALSIAKRLEDQVDGFCIAVPEEAMSLIEGGIKKPLLCLSYVTHEWYPTLVRYAIRPTLFDLDSARALNEEARRQGRRTPFHLGLDTGHSRIGMMWQDPDLMEKIKAICQLDHLQLEGMYSHFASADEADESYMQLQFERFQTVANQMTRLGYPVPIRHICNDAGLLRHPEFALDAVRLGIGLYGIYPSDFVKAEFPLDLAPVFCWRTEITNVKAIEPGTPVSYNHRWRAQRESRIATLQIGYADGYFRSLTNQSDVLILGHRCPQVGAVCMDQMMVDVTDLEAKRKMAGQAGVAIGEKAYLIGQAPKSPCVDPPVTADELARLIGTIPYEIMTSIAPRVSRIYLN